MTLEDYLLGGGDAPASQYRCESCGNWHPPFALKHTRGRKGECAACLIGRDREPSVDPGTTEPGWEDVRAFRNILIQRTDWTQLADVGQNISLVYEKHRAALRDVTDRHATPAKAMAWLQSVESFKP